MKRILVAFVAIIALTAGLATPAFAQDQTISAEPGSVDAAGEHTIVVTGTGYSEPGFLLPCPGANGVLADLGEDSCDLAALTPVAPDADGNFTSPEVTFDIPAEGLVLVVGNAAQTEVAATLISVGAPEAATTAADDAEEEAPAADAPADALPATGVESYYYVVIGFTVLAAGALFMRSSRQLGSL